MPGHLFIGGAIIALAEYFLFAHNQFVSIFFTPLVWTGYIFFIDGLIFWLTGRSLLMDHRREFLLMFPLSAFFWWVFEFFNLFLRNWRYEGLPSPGLTILGMTWAFATIGPGLLETRQLIEEVVIDKVRGRPLRITPSPLLILLGATFLLLILLLPSRIAGYLGVLLWLSFFFIFDPINGRRGNRSIITEASRGKYHLLLSLLLAGIICGFLWEFWNYWARARWVYSLPYSFGPRIFEMPLFGYLGFPLLALEYFAFYSLSFSWEGGEDAHYND